MTAPSTSQVGQTPDQLDHLADSVLGLSHMSRKLNCDIGEAVGEQFSHSFTGHIEAALRLLPDDFLWAAGTSFDEDTALVKCWANVRNRDPYGDRRRIDISLEAATPEIAMTAACLKARAALSQDTSHE